MAELPGIGILGTGSTLLDILPILNSLGFRVEAVWGRTRESVDHFGQGLNIPFRTTDADKVILHKNVDVIFVNCPPHQQASLVVKTLNIGKHVICGHPPALNQIDAIHMVKSAQYYPSLMAVVSNGLRFLPGITKMRELIQDNYIGHVNLCEASIHCRSLLKEKYNWMCVELMGGGALNLYGGLLIDTVTFITDQKAEKVHGVTKTFTKQTDKINGIRNITSDDFCTFQMEMQDMFANFTINTHFPDTFNLRIIISGSNGYLVLNNFELSGMQTSSGKQEIFVAPAEPNHTDFSAHESNIPRLLLLGLENFLKAVKRAFLAVPERRDLQKDLLSSTETFEDAQYVQAVIDALRKSSKYAKWVKVQLTEEEPLAESLAADPTKRTALSGIY